jgi:hypothetical protein
MAVHVVIARRQMLAKIPLRVGKIQLRLGRQHDGSSLATRARIMRTGRAHPERTCVLFEHHASPLASVGNDFFRTFMDPHPTGAARIKIVDAAMPCLPGLRDIQNMVTR